MSIWEEEERRRFRPHLFTPEAWALMSPRRRDLIRLQRTAVVDALALEHERRYHSTSHLVGLAQAMHEGPDEEA
jgi:hypothetical protein